MRGPAASREDGLLLQEVLVVQPDGPWRVLVGCCLLNKTSRKQADRVWPELFLRWPSPSAMASADAADLEELLRPLGFGRVRAKRLVEMSSAYAAGSWSDVVQLPGVGKYASDSWKIFVEGDRSSVDPDDKELKRYLAVGERNPR